ncbi:conserved hypothetical protein [Chelatococcus asaccharovorans]|nr:conserved hypothetical protein [Chelatococcus asaccharovorans]CAH1678212.1 conserved hypothetical protein [Chelatococcus asaccharovorans]
MRSTPELRSSKLALSRTEARHETTSKAARDILGQEEASRDAKTARLRAARLEQEAREPTIAPPVKARRKPKAVAAAR